MSANDGELVLEDDVLKQLKAMLSKYDYKNLAVDVLLSAHYVKYLVNQPDYRLTQDEQNAFIRHAFEVIYGEEVSNWDIVQSLTGFGRREFVCAVNSYLIKELSSALQAQGFKIKSVRPALIAAVNYFRSRISPNAWFIFIEQNNMQLVKFSQGSPELVRTTNLYQGWQQEIEHLLARESLFMLENKLPIYFFWPEKPDFTHELLRRHKITMLRLKAVNGFAAERDSIWAIGLCA